MTPENRLNINEVLRQPVKRRIGCDLDGVVVDSHVLTSRGIKLATGVDVARFFELGIRNDYWVDNWPEIMAVPGGQEFVRKMFTSSYVFRYSPAIKGAVEALNRLRLQGHEIYFATARPMAIAEEPTKEWFRTHGLAWASDRVYFADQIRNGGSHKNQIATSLNLEVFIDDSAETMSGFEAELALKLVPIRDWNRDKDIGVGSQFVANWEEIESKINSLA
jgi:phosphoglycolate phosphatase-like HAD superfamily hydrolase